jgi:conjugal transfer/type IV secretion protein DotA/TraY
LTFNSTANKKAPVSTTANQPPINELSWLIPTGEHDLAVREVLTPILGDAVACKVPGGPCGAEQYANATQLISGLFSLFGVGTMIAALILLFFVMLMGIVKTGSDGELLGKSWNTTFTVLRMLAGFVFVLPNPNGLSTIQNFTVYVGLWSSGMANETNKVVAQHYLARVHRNMSDVVPSTASVSGEAERLLYMHVCADLINRNHQTANITMQRRNLINGVVFDTSNSTQDNTGSPWEVAYVERGAYLIKDSAPCGRLILKAVQARNTQNEITTSNNVINANQQIQSGWFSSDPVSSQAATKMLDAMDDVARRARTERVQALNQLAAPTGRLRELARRIVDQQQAPLVKFDANGSPIAPTASQDTTTNAAAQERFVEDFMAITQAVDRDLRGALNESRRVSAITDGASDSEYFVMAQQMLTSGGWMASATTYRAMLDMSSIKYEAQKQDNFRVEQRDKKEMSAIAPGVDGLDQRLATAESFLDTMMSSEKAADKRTQLASGAGGSRNIEVRPINEADLAKIAKSGWNSSLETLYGSSLVSSIRGAVWETMALGSDKDPLYQIKTLGDYVTGVSEALIVGEAAIRVGVGAVQVTTGAVNSIPIVGEAKKGVVEGVKYILEFVFVTMRSLATAMAALGYGFTTWIPNIPFAAFLVSILGWLAGLLMTMIALNIWAVMHTTPARQDSFIGSESQGYLMLIALFFRPMISTMGLSLSHLVAPPVIKLVNMTLLPMLYLNNVSTNSWSVVVATMFGLVFYFFVIKGVILLIYTIPQTFPDEVMRIISAGIGDLGQSRSMSTLESSNRVGSELFQGRIKKSQVDQRQRAADAKEKAAQTANSIKDVQSIG